MAKKITIEIKEQVNKKPVVRPKNLPISLIIGSWKEQFTDAQVKLIIAEALNDCTFNHKLHIVGYLITNKKVYLVLKIVQADLAKMLDVFFEKVRKLICQRHDKSRSLDTRTNDEGNIIRLDESSKKLFLQCTLINDHLIKLITGQQVTLPYYDPHLVRLKEQIHNNNYCSALDYSGAKGPVIIIKNSRIEST